MDVTRINAVSPPDAGRSKWARDMLSKAIDLNLDPSVVSPARATTFAATLPSHLVARLKELNQSTKRPIGLVAAGLIEAARAADDQKPSSESKPVEENDIAGLQRVRPLLHDMLRDADAGISDGKIVFAEAATGSGKGRMIASLAANAAERGDTVVVSAPLAVTWQLIAELKALKEARQAGINVILGRANFVSPERLRIWAEEVGNKAVLEWIDAGGPPLSEHTKKASKAIKHSLSWMIDDVQTLADDVPLGDVMLANDDNCQAEVVYQALRGNEKRARILFCSHHMLASNIRQIQLHKLDQDDSEQTSLSLPVNIDTLLIDEAHDLEAAFASVNTHHLHLRQVIKNLKAALGPTRSKKLTAAIQSLSDFATNNIPAKESGGHQLHFLSDLPELAPILNEITASITDTMSKRSSAADEVRPLLNTLKLATKGALSGRMAIRFEKSPVRGYPQMLVGRSNLGKPFDVLWNNVAGAALISATLFNNKKSAKLTRWKLNVPAERCMYLTPVAPTWTTSLVCLKPARVPTTPDESDQWISELADQVQVVAEQARGGVLALCTSYSTAEKLKKELQFALGDRLIAQSQRVSASICAARFREMYKEGKKPVWLGLGAAWSGIDLSDSEAPAKKDLMLSDLIITRLPLGLNRSLTHTRRVSIAGFGVISQEASWQLRQGIGRLVRREAVPHRNLWVMDSRLDSQEAWIKPFRDVLGQYRTNH